MALALVAAVLPATPAAAAPQPTTSAALVSGPTYVYDKAYAGVRTMVVAFRESADRSMVALLVTGMPRSAWGKRFGAHVHTNPCGRTPASSGPHYQFPGVPPKRPLSQREIWLDVTVMTGGWGYSYRPVPLPLERGAQANSVVLHARPTNSRTGDAGARLLCTTFDLDGLS
jgi:Cu-Zn family superoxide dismutase